MQARLLTRDESMRHRWALRCSVQAVTEMSIRSRRRCSLSDHRLLCRLLAEKEGTIPNPNTQHTIIPVSPHQRSHPLHSVSIGSSAKTYRDQWTEAVDLPRQVLLDLREEALCD